MVCGEWLPGLSAGLGFLLNSVAGDLADPIIDQGLNRIVPPEQRATLLSFNSTAFSVFMIVVFPLFGVLAEHAGVGRAAHMASIAGAVSMLSAVVWWRRGSWCARHDGSPASHPVKLRGMGD